MTILRRINQLFHADVHAILDQIEDPQALLNQSIRDMDESVAASEEKLKQIERDYEKGCQQLNLMESELAKLDAELDLCLAAVNETLAKNLVRRKLQTEKLLDTLASANTDRKKSISDQAAQLQERKMILEGLKQKADAFCEPTHAESQTTESAVTITSEQVDIALLREKQKRQDDIQQTKSVNGQGGAV